MRDLHVDLLAGLVPAPLDKFFIAVKVLAIITIVRSFKLHLVVVLFGRLVGLPFSSESFDDAFGFRRLGGVRVGIYKVDDLRGVKRSRGVLAASTRLVSTSRARGWSLVQI